MLFRDEIVKLLTENGIIKFTKNTDISSWSYDSETNHLTVNIIRNNTYIKIEMDVYLVCEYDGNKLYHISNLEIFLDLQ